MKEPFNRALKQSFCWSKWIGCSVSIVVIGLIFLFFGTLAASSAGWLKATLGLLPLFLSVGLFCSLGVILVKLYDDELQRKKSTLLSVAKDSLQLLLGTSYITIPLFVLFIVLWIFLGLYQLLSYTPLFGSFIGVTLSFVPFLIYVALFLILAISVITLFYLVPPVAINGWEGREIIKQKLTEILVDPFNHGKYLLIALIPPTISLFILLWSARMAKLHFKEVEIDLFAVQWVIVLIPFAALLAPSVLFFFNFAHEIYSRNRGKSS